ncbi:MAG: hypothetical protein IPG62_14270 [Sphingomonadales bacterium]|nr:hypothetical protein [Sphingomonadales bacterium]
MQPRKRLLMIAFAGAASALMPVNSWASPLHPAGAGALACDAFVQRAGPDGLADPASMQWVLGYLTGRAAATNAWHRPFAGPEGVALDVLAYCRAHPVGQLDDAAAHFFERNSRCGTAHACK